ncbi:MAG: methyltransferase domain-containing protein [Alphaproteobacteria bacterium]|nr:MAG: methyltransferase domain-containing protein [Alphaproteobacteria bacterium]
MTLPLFVSSGDLIADRRYDLARAYATDGDLAAAADLFAQAVELSPRFASAWFALGETREALGDRAGARAAFEQARNADPEDRHGAALHLARLGAADPATAALHGYVRTLFDQYAPRFDRALADLSYSAPVLLRDAVTAHGRRFGTMLDLGCGTGLAGFAFRPHVDWLIGVDLSPKMIEEARKKGLYDRLTVGDIAEYLAEQRAGKEAFHLVIAADVFAYVADLAEICRAVAEVLSVGGLFGFTVETHEGEGAIVGGKMRYAHGAEFVRAAVKGAGLTLLELEAASSRTENRVPVPGLLVLSRR